MNGAFVRRRRRVGILLLALLLTFAAGFGVYWYRAARALERATLRLVDPSGRPAVGLDVLATHHRFGSSRSRSFGPSDPQGHVDLSGLTTFGVFGRIQYTVQLIGFATPDVPWQEQMTIVVPRHGEVTLQLVGAGGEPWTGARAGDMRVTMQWAPAYGGRAARFDERGLIALGAVACDSRVTVEVGFHLRNRSIELAVPEPGEHVEQRIAVPLDGPRLRGTLIDADGAPAAARVHVRGRLRYPRGSQFFSDFRMTPDPAGAFVFWLPEAQVRGTVTFTGGDSREATVELPRPSAEGILELGTVQLAR